MVDLLVVLFSLWVLVFEGADLVPSSGNRARRPTDRNNSSPVPGSLTRQSVPAKRCEPDKFSEASERRFLIVRRDRLLLDRLLVALRAKQIRRVLDKLAD